MSCRPTVAYLHTLKSWLKMQVPPDGILSAEETDHVRDAILQVRKRGISVLVIDHNMRFISGLCDRVVVMAAGQELAQGKPQEVFRQPAVIEAYLGKSNVTARHQ